MHSTQLDFKIMRRIGLSAGRDEHPLATPSIFMTPGEHDILLQRLEEESKRIDRTPTPSACYLTLGVSKVSPRNRHRRSSLIHFCPKTTARSV